MSRALPILYHPDYLRYNFGPAHPFTPVRQEMLLDLFAAFGYPLECTAPEPATDEDLLRVHSPDYLRAVASASVLAWTPGMMRYGLDTPDVPIFPGMDEAGRMLVGGTLEAARIVADGKALRALQLGGGLHHAFPARASGFCVYNDLAVAIDYLCDRGLRVAYIDIDVHHGDGVQWMFYDRPEVLTISLHESGEYLFPGTGMEHEQGTEAGLGASINIPLNPDITPAAYLARFESVVPTALEAFRPDVLVVQAGADAHFKDPLAHLSLTTHTFERLHRLLVEYADRYAGGRAVFTLGGGYDLDAAVRVWAILIHVLQGRAIPERMPEAWLERWGTGYPRRMSGTLHDGK
ncbi:MAG: acetoin utilization protein AcuC [Rhodothermales bacterium]|nr:acetoin utilization protein AcuC [Rhodothermales bacterium]